MLLFIALQQIQRKVKELMDRPIGNLNEEMFVKSEKKVEESGEMSSNERFPAV